MQHGRNHFGLTRFAKDPRWKDKLRQVLATQYSLVGRTQEALETFDSVLGRPHQPQQPVSSLDDYEASDAVATILKLSDQYQVIMVNEAHYVPMHRAFTIQLLDDLYRQGFRYSHISKKVFKGDKGELRFMALAFQALTKIEPLCIDQTMMTEHGQREKESVEYQYTVERKLVRESATVMRINRS